MMRWVRKKMKQAGNTYTGMFSGEKSHFMASSKMELDLSLPV
jgi:hypothetical protein